MDKILTIVIAAYNVEKYIEQTLSSCVLQEEYRDLYEVIIVNDGSKDCTKNIAQSYVERYDNCFKLIDKENGGYGSAINAGIVAAQGKYVKLLDGDDWFDQDGLMLFLEKLQKVDCDMIMTDYNRTDIIGGVFVCGNGMRKNTIVKVDDIPKEQEFFSMHAICYKTEVLKRKCIKLTEHCFYTDSEYVLYPLIYIQTVIYFPINLYQYRIGVEGQSVSLDGIRKHLKDLEKVISQINTYFDNYGKKLPENVDYRISALYKNFILGILVQRPSIEMRKKLTTFICEIKRRYPKRYQYMRNRKIQLIALSHGLLYWICVGYMRYIEKEKSYL